jgi:hypothetical protein
MAVFSSLKLFFAHRKASVTVMAAFAIPAMLGFTALVGEIGNALLMQVEDQRVADSAAYAAALAYNSTSSTTTMTSAAQNVGVLNGLAASAVSASLVVSPRSASSQAVMVTVQSTAPLFLAPVLSFGSSMSVDAKAYAQVGASVSGCVIALSATGAGVTLSGGTSISAPSCSVASNNSIVVPCGDAITAKSLSYNGAAPSQPCGGITGAITKASVSDPLATNAGVIAASARAVADESLTAPTIASVHTGASITFDYSNSAVAVASAAGCVASYSDGTWTVTCPSGGTYNFGALSLGGGITVNFNVNGSAANTYNFSGEIYDSGSKLVFGPGIYNVAQGIRSGGGSVTTFGAGTFNVGRDVNSCNGEGYFSICNTGSSMTFGGPSVFVLTSGIYNSGGETLTLGSGTTNSFSIGPATDGNAVYLGGGSVTTFADATGAGDLFRIVGNMTESGGGCTTISAASYHDVDGNISLAGGLSLGSGLYAISGYLALGVFGGGDVWCALANANVGVSGTNVTIAVAGSAYITDFLLNKDALYLGAGFSHVTLVAPTSGAFANIAIVGPTSASNAYGVQITEGASLTSVGGVLYFPNGPLGLNGGASIGAAASSCFSIIASQVTLAGGTSISASSCFGGGGSTPSPTMVN